MPVDPFSPSALDHVVGIDEFGTYYFDDGSYHTYTNDQYPWTYSRLQAEIPANLPQPVQQELAGTFPQGYGGGPLYGPGGVLIPSLTSQETYLDRDERLAILQERASKIAEQYPGATVISPSGAIAQAPMPQVANPREEQKRMTTLERAGGNGYYTFDEWNWFYEQATGTPGPAPEDVGLSRDSQGRVLVNGQEYIDYDTWARAAKLNLVPQPTTPLPVQPGKGIDSIINLIKRVMAWLVSGRF